MEIISLEYSEVDTSLPYIDKEYDYPMVKDAVHALIAQEMQTFAPSSSYLKHLPYPTLKFANSPMLQAEFMRMKESLASTGTSSSTTGAAAIVGMSALDTKRYAAEQPEAALEKDVQAWRAAVSNAKSQREHQITRVINLELAEELIAPVWLQHNKQLEGQEKQVVKRCENVSQQIDEVNVKRKREQESVAQELSRQEHRMKTALWTSMQVSDACRQMEDYLRSVGVSVDEVVEMNENEDQVVGSDIEPGTEGGGEESTMKVDYVDF